ncbi:hypothetical protein ACTFIU_000560 [Dictyostelium citrinum]
MIADTPLKTSYLTFCSLGSSYGSCENGSITDLTIRPTLSLPITYTDISCLPYLKSLSIINGNVDTNILKTDFKITSLYSFNINFETGKIDNLVWGTVQNAVSTITPFALKNILSFYSTSNCNLVRDSVVPDYINNYTTTYSGLSDNMPDLSTMIRVGSISMTISSTFNESSFVNFKTYSQVLKSISVSGATTTRFPYEIANGVSREYIYFSTDGFIAPSSPIDLSNIPFVSSFLILKMGQDFNYQGNFPFSKLPLKTTNIQFLKGNTTNVDWSTFKNVEGSMLQDLKITTPFPSKNPFGSSVKSFDVSQNQVTGQIDESWCSINLILTKNLFTGKIPNCFYCYLNIQTIGNNFAQNNFDNYDIVNNKCGYDIIVPYFYYNKTTTITTLMGKNLGWTQTNFKTSNCVLIKSGDSFIAVGCTGTYTNVTFTNQNLNFTLSLDHTAPIIDNVIQSNNTLTISGSYFSYEPSIMKVTIGDTPLNCQLNNNASAPLTFYSIQCDIEYPVIEYGPKNVIVQVNSLISKPFEINLDYTKFECPISDCNGNGICNDHIGVCECSKDWKTIDQDICTVAIHYLSSYSQTSDIDGGIINLYGFFGNVHNDFMVLIDGNEYSPNVPPTSSVIAISIGSGKIGTNSSIEIIQNGLTFHGTIYPYSNLIKECPSNCNNNNGKCNTTTGECACNNGYTGVDCIKTTNSTLPSIASTISNVGALFRSEQTVFTASLYSFIEIDYKGIIVNYATISSWKTETIDQGIKYIGTSSNGKSTFELTFLKVSKNQQFSFAGNEYNVGAGGIKMSITVSNYTYSNQSNYLVAALQAKAESDASATTQNKCNNGTIVITSQSNSNLTLNNYNYFTISKDGKRLSIRLQDRLISDDQSTYMVNQLGYQLPDQSLLFGMSLPHCGKQCSIDGPDFIVNIESNYKTASACTPTPTPTPTPKSSSEEQPSSSLKESSISIVLIIISILISLSF